jgi:membrane protein YdbS with pleckstrin-like domain
MIFLHLQAKLWNFCQITIILHTKSEIVPLMIVPRIENQRALFRLNQQLEEIQTGILFNKMPLIFHCAI